MESKVRNLIEESINNAGIILDEVLYVNENGVNYLRIVLDKKDDYININDCITVNDLISPILDKADLIEDSYTLDICSKIKE